MLLLVVPALQTLVLSRDGGADSPASALSEG
jgi:hypothetical protein